MISELKKDMNDVDKANEDFRKALDGKDLNGNDTGYEENYKDKMGEDSYYTSMMAQSEKVQSLLSEADLIELEQQVTIVLAYATELERELNKDNCKFYGKAFPTKNTVSGKDFGKAARRALANKAKTDASFAKGTPGLEERAWEAFVTVMSSALEMNDGFYLKKFNDARTIQTEAGDVYLSVPHACITLAAQYENDEEEKNDGKNVKENLTSSVKNMADNANKTESSEEETTSSGGGESSIQSPYDYLYTVFYSADSTADDGNGGKKAEEIKDANTGAITQLRSMIELVSGLMNVLNEVITGNLENIRDDLLVTEYMEPLIMMRKERIISLMEII